MKYFWLILSWIFGIGLMVLAIPSLFAAPVTSTLLIGMALLILPPVRSFVHAKTNKTLTLKARSILLVALFALFVTAVFIEFERKGDNLTVEQSEQQTLETEQARQELIREYSEAKENILAQIQDALHSADYEIAVVLAKEYLTVEEELAKLQEPALADSEKQALHHHQATP